VRCVGWRRVFEFQVLGSEGFGFGFFTSLLYIIIVSLVNTYSCLTKAYDCDLLLGGLGT
jgi:hypothetical protein